MIDIENEIITLAHNTLAGANITAALESVTNLNPATFPTVCIEEIENASYGSTSDSRSNENHAAIGYEINVFTNDVSGKKQRAKEILDVLDEQMILVGFLRMSKTALSYDNGTKYRLVARYRAVVDKNNTIYRR